MAFNHKNNPEIPSEILQSISPTQAWHYRVCPVNMDENKLVMYISDEQDTELVADELEMLTGKNIEFEIKPSSEIDKILSFFYRGDGGKHHEAEDLQLGDDFLDQLIFEATDAGASDIHIEAYEEKGRIRFRIDGKLLEKYQVKPTDYPSLVNKIKIRANLDIAEKRLPQDGRIYSRLESDTDIRVSTMPALYGEKIVLRILNKDTSHLSINKLGMSEEQLEQYLISVRKTSGIILISGPTGSGKTTTLYATLKELNSIDTNIVTIEDPIEYTLEGVNQVQLKESIGLTYSSALRTFLRQDPDIIMLGEIRDAETAQMAIRAALTGHLVLTTIHTNSAWGSISRLNDMGIPPFFVASTLNMSVAQRLIRKLCPQCKTAQHFSNKELPKGYTPPEKINKCFAPTGCSHCHYTGYRGRKAIYEIIPVNSEISDKIKQNTKGTISKSTSLKITSLADQAFESFANGEASLEDIYPILLTSL